MSIWLLLHPVRGERATVGNSPTDLVSNPKDTAEEPRMRLGANSVQLRVITCCFLVVAGG